MRALAMQQALATLLQALAAIRLQMKFGCWSNGAIRSAGVPVAVAVHGVIVSGGAPPIALMKLPLLLLLRIHCAHVRLSAVLFHALQQRIKTGCRVVAAAAAAEHVPRIVATLVDGAGRANTSESLALVVAAASVVVLAFAVAVVLCGAIARPQRAKKESAVQRFPHQLLEHGALAADDQPVNVQIQNAAFVQLVQTRGGGGA